MELSGFAPRWEFSGKFLVWPFLRTIWGRVVWGHEQSLCVTFLCSFPGNEAHKLFSGGPNWGVLGGGGEVSVEKVYVLFLSLSNV